MPRMSFRVSGISSEHFFLLKIKARRVLFACQIAKAEDKHLEAGLREQEKLRMTFSDITFESRLYVRKFFQLNISEGVRIGEEVAVATNCILFILFIEMFLFTQKASFMGKFMGQFSVGYLILGTHEPGASIFSKKYFLLWL